MATVGINSIIACTLCTCTCTHIHMHSMTCTHIHAFCHVPIKNIANLFANMRSKSKKLPINSVQGRLQKVSFSRILTIKQFQQLHVQTDKQTLLQVSTFTCTAWQTHHSYKSLINVFFGNSGLEILGLKKPQEKLINNLTREANIETHSVRHWMVQQCTWRCGQDGSNAGSSSSGSNSAPDGLVEGGKARNAFWANWNNITTSQQ